MSLVQDFLTAFIGLVLCLSGGALIFYGIRVLSGHVTEDEQEARAAPQGHRQRGGRDC